MKKKLFALLLSLVMVAALLPVTVQAEEPAHASHCECGTEKLSYGGHAHTAGIEWIGITSLNQINRDGYFYLTGTSTRLNSWYCSYNATVCLNGHDIILVGDDTGITVNSGKTLTITDCRESMGKITHSMKNDEQKYQGRAITVKGALVLYNGAISGNEAAASGAGVAVYEGGSFVMRGGKISENKTSSYSSGGGVWIRKGEFTMTGGVIEKNYADGSGGGVYNVAGTILLDSSATIRENEANFESGTSSGGGVANYHGSFTMQGGTIANNRCGGNGGGGVSIQAEYGNGFTTNATLNMTGGIIAANTSSMYGGGLGLYAGQGVLTIANIRGTAQIYDNTAQSGGGVAVNGGAQLYLSENAAISSNKAERTSVYRGNGGGVFLTTPGGYSGYGYFMMLGGTISGNTASRGGGVFVPSGATFQMQDGTITGNKAPMGGGVYAQSEKIVLRYTPKITGNQNNDDGSASNLYFYNGDGSKGIVPVSAAELLNGASIGVSLWVGATYPATVTKDAANKNYFFSDNDAYEVAKADDGTLILQERTTPPAEHKHCVCATGELSAEGHTHDKEQVWTPVSDLSEITGAGYYYLTKNIVLEQYVSTDNSYSCYGWVAPDGAALCLNGYSITMKNPAEADVDKTQEENKYYDGYVDVIQVEGTFTLTDCKPAAQQGIISHGQDASGTTYNGRGVHVEGGTFNQFGGKISGNTTAYDVGGAGVAIEKGSDYETKGVYNLYDGEISGNTGKNGGGVSVFGGTFRMFGGRIVDNTADHMTHEEFYGKGGGVYVGWTSEFEMLGGEISGNSANKIGAGVYLTAYAKQGATVYFPGGTATFKVSGGAVVENNRANGVLNNVYLASATSEFDSEQATITIEGALTGRIGVTAGKTPGLIATGADANTDYSGILLSDNADYSILHNPDDATQLWLSDGTPLPPVYRIVEGANGSWKQGSESGLSFRADGDVSKFAGVTVDGYRLDAGNYEVASDATVVTLKPEYLASLESGEHTLVILYSDGECSTTFTVKDNTPHDHFFGEDWKADGENHWHECECGEVADKAAHTFVWKIDREATEQETGLKHEECSICGAKRNENTVIDKLAGGGETPPNPNTGDTRICLWVALSLIAGASVVLFRKKKENR